MFRQFLTDLKEDTIVLNYGRHIVTEWAASHATKHTSRPFRVLDIGFGLGTDLKNICEEVEKLDIKCEIYGLDTYRPSLELAASQNISAAFCNIENNVFPYNDCFFDLVVANQVIEHTKEIFWIYSELSRIVKPGGVIITGVPNIASLHNRIGMLFGVQPTNIELLGPHVRGFTADSFINFIETDGYFKNLAVRGSNFYPFPAWLAQVLASLFPRLAVSVFLLTQRTEKPGLFRDVLSTRFFETPFYVGQINPS